jgi:hypothetical protein
MYCYLKISWSQVCDPLLTSLNELGACGGRDFVRKKRVKGRGKEDQTHTIEQQFQELDQLK